MIVDKLEKLKEDGEYPSFLSADYSNQVVDIINALRRLEVKGGRVTWSDAKVVIEFSGSSGGSTTSSSGSLSGSFSGSIIYDRSDVWQ